NVLEIATVRRDEKLGSKEARLFTPKSPGDIRLVRMNFLQVNSIGQKDGEPRLRSHWFWMAFVNLDLHVARLHLHTIKSPLPHQYAPRVELGSDAVSDE